MKFAVSFEFTRIRKCRKFYLNALVRAEVEVEFGRMGDASIDCCAGRDVARLSRLLFLVGAEKPRVVALLDSDERNTGFVICLQLDACFTDSSQLVLQYLQKYFISKSPLFRHS